MVREMAKNKNYIYYEEEIISLIISDK